jgi:hypothetical protein
MATVMGIKPCMDDWIRVDNYEEYRKICKRYSLFVKPDTIFNIVEGYNIPIDVIGKESLTTTKAFGFPFNRSDRSNNNIDGSLHVFISKSKENLEKCFKNGWYSLIIRNRVIDKPLIDAFKYGYDLGYPECCVNFFRQFNNWNKYSYLYEAFKNTPLNKYCYLCNPFTKDITYSYIYHMPCSYNCRETIKLARRIREAIYEEEPEFVKEIDRHLKLPLLVFYERKFYAFEGKIKNDRLYYKNVYFIGQMPENNLYEVDLNKGDCIFIENKDVVILNKGRLIKRIKWQKRDFAPEMPFIIQFN